MDGASGGSGAIGDPEGLLRSALEKIVFFECRVSQLESELSAARTAAERARGDAAKAHVREVEVEQAISRERGARQEAERGAADAGERVRLLETERERLLGGLVDRARVAGSPGESEPAPDEGGADLAGFIAELRAEIEVLRAFKEEAQAAGFGGGDSGSIPPEARRGGRATSLTALAAGFQRAGRVGVTAGDAERMKDLLGTRADRALYERSMDDLSAADAGRRLRAVRALEALGSKAAAPLLAASLGREQDPSVKSALLVALARLGEPFVADLAAREMEDRRPTVRVAALDALAAAGAAASEPRLARALGDESPLVRRRAALLLGFVSGDRAEDALGAALADPDRGVARTAAAALSGRPSARAQGALARGLDHADASVRRAAASALSRISGEEVDSEAPPSARRAASRRIAAKLAGMGGEEIRAAVMRSADTRAAGPTPTRAAGPTPAASPLRSEGGRLVDTERDGADAPPPASTAAKSATATPTPTARAPRSAIVDDRIHSPLPHISGGEGQGEGATARAAVAVLTTEAPARQPEPAALEQGVLAEIRMALRGCTPEDLTGALGVPPPGVDAALHALAARGEISKRGTRWFTS